jgi:DNA-binding NtrC family response regulator
VVEDDQTMRQTLGTVFRKKGIMVFESGTGMGGLDILRNQKIDVLLLDMKLPDIGGLEFWSRAKDLEEGLLCIFMTAYPEIKTAVTVMREGAFDYINKPFELEEMKLVVDKAFEVFQLRSEVLRLQHERKKPDPFLGMIGTSDAIKKVQDQIYKVAQSSDTPVLVVGESGTGKELVADAIQNLSDRKDNPFLKVNCASIPETLLETELFGHERGAFTDAKHLKKGIFELADSGTIFLDEVGDLCRPLQPKLLRVLESKSIRRVGGAKDFSIDVRVISATNQDLPRKVQNGEFRLDLLYRLNVFFINLPPLRKRIGDIPYLTCHFLEQSKVALNKKIDGIAKDALEKLMGYDWPGNIRELKNVIERACILCTTKTVQAKDLSLDQSPRKQMNDSPNEFPFFPSQHHWPSLEELELFYIQKMLDRLGGNKSEAARQLGISRVTLREKLQKLKGPNRDS